MTLSLRRQPPNTGGFEAQWACCANAISQPAGLIVCRSYAPHLERLHEDAALRQADLLQLFAVSEGLRQFEAA